MGYMLFRAQAHIYDLRGKRYDEKSKYECADNEIFKSFYIARNDRFFFLAKRERQIEREKRKWSARDQENCIDEFSSVAARARDAKIFVFIWSLFCVCNLFL